MELTDGTVDAVCNVLSTPVKILSSCKLYLCYK